MEPDGYFSKDIFYHLKPTKIGKVRLILRFVEFKQAAVINQTGVYDPVKILYYCSNRFEN